MTTPGWCSSCGYGNDVHADDCRALRNAERLKLQAACKHLAEYGLTRTTGDPPGPPCCGRCGIELDDVLPSPTPDALSLEDMRRIVARMQAAARGAGAVAPPEPWSFVENYASGTGCQHPRVYLLNQPEPELRCSSCDKLWVFVPPGVEPSYFDDDHQTYPGMVDNRDWPKGNLALVARLEEKLDQLAETYRRSKEAGEGT